MADIKQGAAASSAAAAAGSAAKSQAAAASPAAAAAAPARKRLPMKLIVMVASVLLLAAGGAGAFVYMKNRKSAPATEEVDKSEPRRLPNFVDLEQFTVNLADKDQDRYMQIKFSLEVESHEAEATIKEMMPALRSEILLALGSRPAADLTSREGKEALAKDIVAAANKSLEHTAAEHSVSAVRITQLIIQ
jgi:flagellar FliL protein